jgi:hypothetical protein
MGGFIIVAVVVLAVFVCVWDMICNPEGKR